MGHTDQQTDTDRRGRGECYQVSSLGSACLLLATPAPTHGLHHGPVELAPVQPAWR